MLTRIPQESPLVINLAPTGMVPRRAQHPAVPEQPNEIAADVLRCVDAGASTVHVHARDSLGEPSCHRDAYAETIRLLRAARPDLVICVSTSGRRVSQFEQRGDVLELDGDLKPDLASLTLGSFNFPREVSANSPEMIGRLAARMFERGIVPEIEIFDLGMLDYAEHLISKGVLRPPFVMNLLLGSLGTLAASVGNLSLLVDRLPAGTYWQAAGIGRAQWPMNALAVIIGGHVRTGLEDNLYLDSAKHTPATNESLVSRVAGLAEAFGRTVASPREARELMGLPPRN